MPWGPYAPGIAGGWENASTPPGFNRFATNGSSLAGSVNQAAPKIE